MEIILTGKKSKKNYSEIKASDLSIRSKNILLRNNITSFNQLIEIDIGKLQGSGLASEKELKDFLKNYKTNLILEEQIPEIDLSNYTGLDKSIDHLYKINKVILKRLSKLDIFTIRDFLERELEILNTFKSHKGYSSLAHHVPTIEDIYYELHSKLGLKDLNFLEALNIAVGKEEYMSSRLKGLKTLEECGKIVRKTRERVRQIEKIKIHNFKKMISLEKRVLSIYNNSNEPLFIEKIPLFDKDLAGIEKLNPKSPLLQKIFNKNSSSELRFEICKRKILFSKKNSPTYEELFKFLKENNFNKEEDIISEAKIRKRYDLKDLLCSELLKVPTSDRGKINFYVTQILDEATSPLKPVKIRNILKEKFNFTATGTALGNFLHDHEDAYIFDSNGGWGLESKFRKFNDNEVILIMEKLIRIFHSEDNKQLTSNYLLDSLLKKYKEDEYLGLSRLKKFDLEWILKKCSSSYPKLQKLGRGNWSYGESNKVRKTYAGLVLDALELAKKPLSIKEIKKIISDERSLSSNFQLHMNRSNPNLIEVEPKVWGLKNRDINLTSKEEGDLLDEVRESLLNSKKNFLDLNDLESICHTLNLNKLPMRLIINVLRTHVNITKENSPIFYLKNIKSENLKIYPSKYIKDE